LKKLKSGKDEPQDAVPLTGFMIIGILKFDVWSCFLCTLCDYFALNASKALMLKPDFNPYKVF
jgi:hypothetical protein